MVNYKIGNDKDRLYYPKLVKFRNGKFGIMLKKHWWSVYMDYLAINESAHYKTANTVARFNTEYKVRESSIMAYCSGTILEVRSALVAYKQVREEKIEPFETIIGIVK